MAEENSVAAASNNGVNASETRVEDIKGKGKAPAGVEHNPEDLDDDDDEESEEEAEGAAGKNIRSVVAACCKFTDSTNRRA